MSAIASIVARVALRVNLSARALHGSKMFSLQKLHLTRATHTQHESTYYRLAHRNKNGIILLFCLIEPRRVE